MFQIIQQDMRKRIARKIVNGWSKPRYKKINPILRVWRDVLTDKMGLQKIYYCDIPIYRRWTARQLARAERRLGIKNEPLLPLKLESMPVEIDMKLKTISV
jgi:hypothetical protein